MPAPVPITALPPQLQVGEQEDEGGSKLYAPFESVRQFEPDYSHAPSLAAQAAAADDQPTQQRLRTTFVREGIVCQECSKPRAIYCQHALKTLQTKLTLTKMSSKYVADQLNMLKEEEQFVCGAQLFSAGHTLCNQVYANHALSCSSPVEQALYSARDGVCERIPFSKQHCSMCNVDVVPSRACEEQGCGPGTAVTKWKQLPLCAKCVRNGKQPVEVTRKRTRKTAKEAVRATKRARAPKRKAAPVLSDEEALADEVEDACGTESEDEGDIAGPSGDASSDEEIDLR